MPSSSTSSARRPAWLVPVLVALVAAVLVAVSLVARGGEDSDAGTAAEPGGSAEGPVAEVVEPEQQALPDMARRDPADPMAAGPVDAPVSLVMYSDFQCPYCAMWSEQTQPTMLERAEAGDLRIEWRDINVFGEASLTSARAAYAAGLQDRYVEYHDALFEGGEKRPASELDEESLIELAGELGLDTERFATDMRSEETAAAVAKNQDEAASLGVYSTPAFLLGGTPILGAQPTEVFVETLDDALAKAQG
ncbi:DsbA family protein [Georgenia daeguensis]|uniref:Thioredoxin domain-containing protein n=1 Tax=Georgenia daeguensis TaxID=908355 RepID=A0ABP8EU50_9MICO